MTEEFWADYKKKKDLTQTNLIWKHVWFDNKLFNGDHSNVDE